MKTKCSCQTYLCLYNSIIYAFGGLKPCSDFWANPLELKKWIKTEKSEQVSPDKIPLLETRIKVAINVVGDYEYTSDKTYPKRITLLYKNGHYSFVKNPRICEAIVKTWTQGLTLVWFHEREEYILTFDGVELAEDYTLDISTFSSRKQRNDNRIYKKFDFGLLTPTMKEKLRHLREQTMTQEHDDFVEECMIECYQIYMRYVDDLKQHNIDISEHGYSIKDTAISLFAKYVKAHEFAPIDETETQWIISCKNFGILHAEPYEGYLFNVDANSFYPSLMRDPKLIVPMGNPEYKTIEKIEYPAVAFGIYRCRISGADSRLFVSNKLNFYTSTDVRSAMKRGYGVELIQDGQPNHLHYTAKNRETGYSLFRGFVDLLYPLKKSNPLIKKLLNILWGALNEKEEIFHSSGYDFGDDITNLENALSEPRITGENVLVFRETKPVYKKPYARVGIFLTALGRARLADVMEPIVNEVKRIHTDGFYTTTIQGIELSSEIGKFKLEDEGIFVVRNMRKPERLGD